MQHEQLRIDDRDRVSSDSFYDWDIRGILAALKRHRLLIGVGCLFGLLGALGYGLLSVPQYEATVEVAPSASSARGGSLSSLFGQLGSLAPLAGIELPGQEEDRTATVVLRSYAFVSNFLQRENALAIVSKDCRGIVATLLNVSLNEQMIVNEFRNRLMRVEEDRRTGTTRLTIRSHDREAAARWANEMIRELNESQRQRALDESRRRITYLEEQISRASLEEIRQALYSVMEGELKAIAIANAREDYTFRVLDPAIPPLENEPVSPNMALLLAFGGMTGGIAGLLLSLVRTRKHDG